MSGETFPFADGFAKQISFFFFPLLAPVALTLMFTVGTVSVFTSPTKMEVDSPLPFFFSKNSSNHTEASFFTANSIISVLGFVAATTFATFFILILYKCGCTMVLYTWILYSCASLLLVLTWIWMRTILVYLGIPYTVFSVLLVVWNLGTVGVLCVAYYTHPLIRQGYLIFASLLMICELLQIPEWTGWLLLVAVALYDIVAVLSPVGPLRLLVEETNHRREPLPGFVYDTDSSTRGHSRRNGMEQLPDANGSTLEHVQLPSTLLRHCHSLSPAKLGLGDFIFYGVLVGLASLRGFIEWTFCFFAILLGMVATFSTFFFYRRSISAFPALPFSIFLGTFIYFSARYGVSSVSVFAAAQGFFF